MVWRPVQAMQLLATPVLDEPQKHTQLMRGIPICLIQLNLIDRKELDNGEESRNLLISPIFLY